MCVCVCVCVCACVLIIIFKCIKYSILIDAHFCNFEINCDTDQLWLVLSPLIITLSLNYFFDFLTHRQIPWDMPFVTKQNKYYT